MMTLVKHEVGLMFYGFVSCPSLVDVQSRSRNKASYCFQ